MITGPLNVEQKAHLGRLAAKEFLQITDTWGLTDDQRRILAGAATRTTISTWRKRVNTQKMLQLGTDTYERIICIKAINDSLQEKLPGQVNCAQLIRQPLSALNGSCLLENMLNGRVIDLYNTHSLASALLGTRLIDH